MRCDFRGEPSLFGQKFRKVYGLEALPAEPFANCFPSGGHVQGRLLRQIDGGFRGFGAGLKFQPEKTVRSEGEAIRLALDGREIHVAEHFDRNHAFELRQIEIHRLREARKIGDAKNLFIVVICADTPALCDSRDREIRCRRARTR